MKTKAPTATIHTGTLQGVDAIAVEVTVTFERLLPRTVIVDMAATSVKETAERVRSAIENSGFKLPKVRRNVDFGGAYVKGASYDLPVAIAMLVAAGEVPETDVMFAGELGLNGDLRPLRGAIALAELAAKTGRTLIVPMAVAAKAALTGAKVIGAYNLVAVVAHLKGIQPPLPPARPSSPLRPDTSVDMNDVVGHAGAKRALEVAAAGGHHVLLVGPPAGKTMLARRLTSIMPLMTTDESLQVAKHFDAAGLDGYPGNLMGRPFRAPHHSASKEALTGGRDLRPGELTLAHNGVLLLDETHEFKMETLEAVHHIARARVTLRHMAGTFIEAPARFTAVLSTYPNDLTLGRVDRYMPGLCDVRIQVEPESGARLLQRAPEDMGHSSAVIRKRVEAAQKLQQERQGGLNGQRSDLPAVERVARTIADLDGSGGVEQRHLDEAVALTGN